MTYTTALLTMNYGQHVLFGFLTTSLHGNREYELMLDELSELAALVIDLTSAEYYEGENLDAPDVQIMIRPQDAFDIFSEWYDENETYFEEYLEVSE